MLVMLSVILLGINDQSATLLQDIDDPFICLVAYPLLNMHIYVHHANVCALMRFSIISIGQHINRSVT